MSPLATIDGQYGGLIILDFLSDLLTASPREQFSRDDVLILLNNVRSNPDLFEPLVVEAYQMATQDID